jgi:hypothetical protein
VLPLHTLEPSPVDIDYLTDFLSEVADICNSNVGSRVAELLTRIHSDDPAFFDASERAEQLANQFRIPITVAGSFASPPP